MSREFAQKFAAFAMEEAKPAPRHDARTLGYFAGRVRDFLRTEQGHKTLQASFATGFGASVVGMNAANVAVFLADSKAFMVPAVGCALAAAVTSLGFAQNLSNRQTTRLIIAKLDAISAAGARDQMVGRLVEIEPDPPLIRPDEAQDEEETVRI